MYQMLPHKEGNWQKRLNKKRFPQMFSIKKISSNVFHLMIVKQFTSRNETFHLCIIIPPFYRWKKTPAIAMCFSWQQEPYLVLCCRFHKMNEEALELHTSCGAVWESQPDYPARSRRDSRPTKIKETLPCPRVTWTCPSLPGCMAWCCTWCLCFFHVLWFFLSQRAGGGDA